MMIMQKLILGGIILLSTIGIAKAIRARSLGKEKRVKIITQKMSKRLSLSQEQQDNLYQINLNRANAHLRAFKQKRNKDILKAGIEQWKSDLKLLLTQEQLKKLMI